ncbi:MAG: N-hydroxyarylamine O-acetyltransferase, partial [Citrobacter sp.]
MTPFLTAYFSRIGWSDTVRVDIETLNALHLLHNSAIPFENLD